MGLVSNKNFVTTNAVEAILSRPAKSEAVERFTMKRDYGKVPAYLARNKETLKKEREAVEAFVRTKEHEVSCAYAGGAHFLKIECLSLFSPVITESRTNTAVAAII